MKYFLKILLLSSIIMGFVYPEHASRILYKGCQWISQVWFEGHTMAPDFQERIKKIRHLEEKKDRGQDSEQDPKGDDDHTGERSRSCTC